MLKQFAGACRYVYNRGLALQQEFYELTQTHVGYADLCAVLTEWKQDPETAWLNAMPSQALQQ